MPDATVACGATAHGSRRFNVLKTHTVRQHLCGGKPGLVAVQVSPTCFYFTVLHQPCHALSWPPWLGDIWRFVQLQTQDLLDVHDSISLLNRR